MAPYLSEVNRFTVSCRISGLGAKKNGSVSKSKQTWMYPVSPLSKVTVTVTVKVTLKRNRDYKSIY